MHLTVIAKAPVAGKVKTRLSPPLSPAQAAAVAAACLSDTFEAVSRSAADNSDVTAHALIDGDPGEWIPEGYEVRPQRGGGLAERLANGFDDLGPGLIIGMDTPTVGALLNEAITALRRGSDVIGMTLDGGYWGIGLATVDRSVFDGIEMSTDRTGADQLDRLVALDRDVVVLPSVRDIDRFGDIAPVVAESPGSHLAAVAISLFEQPWG